MALNKNLESILKLYFLALTVHPSVEHDNINQPEHAEWRSDIFSDKSVSLCSSVVVAAVSVFRSVQNPMLNSVSTDCQIHPMGIICSFYTEQQMPFLR